MQFLDQVQIKSWAHYKPINLVMRTRFGMNDRGGSNFSVTVEERMEVFYLKGGGCGTANWFILILA